MGISVSDVTVDEKQLFARFVVRLSEASSQTVTVNYGTQGVTAGSGDFTATSGTLTFTPGQTALNVDVPIVANTTFEGTEFFKLALSSPVNSTIDTPFGFATIIDNDAAAGTPVIQVGDQVVDESAGTVSFVVTLDRPSTGTVKVDVATASGSATSGTDFTSLATQTLSFLAGETAKTVTVSLTNDSTAEAAEYFDLKLSNAVGGTLTTKTYGRVTIGANDAAPVSTPLITVSDPTADESQSLIDFVVSLSAPSTSTVTVNYATQGITATGSGYDFENTSGTLTFLAGETTKVVHVPLNGYSPAEVTEFFQLNLSGPVNATVVKPFGFATIIDNDAAAGTPVIQVGDQVVDESAGTVSFVVTLDRPSTGTVKVDVATASGSATSGTDFTSLATQTLSFLAGETAKTVTVSLTNDSTAEAAEYFDLKLSNAVGGTLTTKTYGRVTIGANDAAPVSTPLITVSDPTADESQSLIDFVVSLSAPSTSTVTVNYATQGITATGSGYDFENTSGTLTFLAGETTKVVHVPLNGYSPAEVTEFFQLNLSGPVNATVVKPFGFATIIDNDAAAGTPVIQVGDQVVDESAGTVSFVVTLDRPSTGTVKVDVATASGSATSGTDFTSLATQTLSFLAGETAKTVTVSLTNDSTAEAAEYFDLKLSNAVGGTLTTKTYGRVTIGANDAAPVSTPLITVSDPTADESQSLIDFVVSLSAPSTSTVTVNYATQGITATGSGYDFENTSGTLTFLAGETTKVVHVPLNGYSPAEVTEFFQLNLSGPVNATVVKPFGFATIIDNDAAAGTPVIQVGDQVVDESAGTVSFVVTLDRPSTGTVKVDVATASGSATSGTDFTSLATQTLSFLAGETAKTVTVSLTNDSTAEAAEYFDLKLSNAVGGTLTTKTYGRVTIGANDAAPVSTPLITVSDPTADESQSLIDFVVSLSAPSTSTVTVNYATQGITATGSGYDFENTSGTLTFLAGETTKVVHVPLNGYSPAEVTEFFQLNLSGPVNATVVKPFGFATIIDNDAAAGTPVIQVGDQVVDESAGTVSFVVTLDRPSTGTVKVDVATASGSATSGTDFTSLATQTLSFLAGETAKTVTVSLTNDSTAEAAEYFDLKLSNAVGGTIPDTNGRAFIAPSDGVAATTPFITVSDPTADEAQSFIDFVVSLSAPSASPITVNYGTGAVTATGSGYDFENTSGTLTFVAGETIKVVHVPLSAYSALEGTEFFKLNLSGATNATIAKPFGFATIIDNDAAAGTPKLSVGDAVFDESGAFATFTVTLDKPSTGDVKVSAATADGTAFAGLDYGSAGSQTLVFKAGEVSKTVTVALLGDSLSEDAEFFDLVLSSAVGATIDDVRGHAYLPKSDAATATTPSIAAAAIASSEGNSLLEFTVSLSAPSIQSVKVNYTTSNGTATTADYAGTSGTLTFAPGQTLQVVRVPLYEDTAVEGNQTFNLLLSGAVGGTISTPTVVATILDNDGPPAATEFTNNGTANADILVGRAGSNIVSGGNGNDLLDGVAGVVMTGGAGDDTYIVETATDTLTEALNAGTDTVVSYLSSYTLGANVERLVLGSGALVGTGNGLNNTVIGSAGTNTLDGGVGADVMEGRAGDDTYLVDNAGDTTVEVAGGGTDTVQVGFSWTLATEVEKLVLTGTNAINGTGNASSNTLTGNSASNVLTGLGGNDIYVVQAVGDTTIEVAGGGTDTVQTAIAWTLASEVENLTLTGTAAVNGFGNSLANTLTGNSAVNQLTGFGGNDIYVVQTVGDTTIEVAGGGIDTVQTALAWTLASEVENLTLTGTAAVNGVGNALANTLTGNSAINQLTGLGGDDIYVVQTVGDTTVEAAGGGIDTVQSSITWTLANEIENLTLTGTTAINGTGNGLANVLLGNSGANVLNGGVGADTLNGAAGADTLTGGTGADTFVFSSKTGGFDTVTDFSATDDTFSFSMAGIHLGDGDALVENAVVRAAPGGFATTAELVVFTANIAGAITTASAAAAIGSATSAYAAGADVLFAVDNGTQTGLFQFHAAAADALVSSTELTQLALVTGSASSLSDYVFTA